MTNQVNYYTGVIAEITPERETRSRFKKRYVRLRIKDQVIPFQVHECRYSEIANISVDDEVRLGFKLGQFGDTLGVNAVVESIERL